MEQHGDEMRNLAPRAFKKVRSAYPHIIDSDIKPMLENQPEWDFGPDGIDFFIRNLLFDCNYGAIFMLKFIH